MSKPAVPQTAPLDLVGQVANDHAAAHTFVDYRSRKSPHTVRRHDAALGVFSYYLAILHVPPTPPNWPRRQPPDGASPGA